MIALEARNQKQVRELHGAALGAGGFDEGQPGFRDSYWPHFRELPSRPARQQDRVVLERSVRTGTRGMTRVVRATAAQCVLLVKIIAMVVNKRSDPFGEAVFCNFRQQDNLLID